MTIRLFISHSHKDKEIAAKVISLVEGCMQIEHGSIRCTSAQGYNLPAGADLISQLRDELTMSRAVIGIVSPNSVSEAWPLSEMAAAWGLNLSPVSFLFGDLTFQDVKGPLSGTFMINSKCRDNIYDLIIRVAKRLEVEQSALGKINQKIDEFLRFAGDITIASFQQPTQLVPREKIFEPKHRLKWKNVFEDASSRVLIWGMSCREIINGNSRNLFEAMAKSGKALDFLIMDHNSLREANSLNFGPICSTSHNQVADDVFMGEKVLSEFRDGFARQGLFNVNLRKIKVPMSWSGVGIDHSEPSGRLQIELYHYDNPDRKDHHLDSRPNILINRNSEFYSGFEDSINLLWDRSVKF